MSWQALTPQVYALGESPFWHPHEQMLYWVDISGKQLLRANIYMGTVQAWDMPSEPGCIAPAARGGLVVALRHGVFRALEWGGLLTHITTLPYDTHTVRANDGKCDALGRFWVGTIDEPKAGRAAALYSIDCRAGSPVVKRQAGDALTANGLAWSPDNQTLYWADTPNHTVHAWNYDLPTNTLSAHRTHLQLPPKPAGWTFEQSTYAGRPDGAAVDVQGNYYAAMYEGARICKFAPDGMLLAEIPTPAQCPTMPCFGGEDLRTLYLTSARHGRSEAELARYPQSGCVFSMRVDTPGLPVNFFAD
ncbi:MAG: SMP-30/gluconolactonase/LRE family protein [Burkholderiales bacterium]|nr:SMP-30/gluconolactonase/LRE family protein [Burkholderiales bacterium]